MGSAAFQGKPSYPIEQWFLKQSTPETGTKIKFMHKANIYVENGSDEFTVTLDGTQIYPEE